MAVSPVITDLRILSSTTPEEHAQSMRLTPMLRDADLHPFDRPEVVIRNQRLRPRVAEVTSKYVLKGQLALFARELFPRLLNQGVNPFDMHNSVLFQVKYADGSESKPIRLAPPVYEILPELDAGSGIVVNKLAVTDGMMRYSLARAIGYNNDNFTLTADVIDQRLVPLLEQEQFYSFTNPWSDVEFVQAVPDWVDRKDYMEGGQLLRMADLDPGDIQEIRRRLYFFFRKYVGETMPRVDGQDFGHGFDGGEDSPEYIDMVAELRERVLEAFPQHEMGTEAGNGTLMLPPPGGGGIG